MAIKFGLSIHAEIAHHSVFAHVKIIFILIYLKAIKLVNMNFLLWVMVHLDDIHWKMADQKRIRITRAHLEEDAGKSLHEDFHGL